MRNLIRLLTVGVVGSVMLVACGGRDSQSTSSPSKLLAASIACNAAWVSTTTYTAGASVSYQNVNYKAAFWTKGNIPSTNSGTVNSGKAWIVGAACGATTPPPIALSGQYQIRSVLSNLCLSIEGGSTADGAKAVQAACVNSSTQNFDFALQTDGTYRIMNANSSKNLDISGISLADGAVVLQWPSTGADNQRFTLKPIGTGYQMIAKHSGKCVDVKDFSTTVGSAIQQWSCGGNTNQRWTLSPVVPVIPPVVPPVGPPAIIDASTLDNKFIYGYQGWHACAGDHSPFDVPNGSGWRHWSNFTMANAATINVPMWPDMTDVPVSERCATGFHMADGSNAGLYSSWNRSTVNRHFEWMKKYGIDGVFVQEFLVEIEAGTDYRQFRDGVTANVRAGAEANGRIWAIEYDVSGSDPLKLVATIKNHWAAMAANGSLSSKNYIHQNGLPVVEVWGLFTDRQFTPAQATTLINWFQRDAPADQRAYVIGGLGWFWRGDSDRLPAWRAVYNLFDAINPWMVGVFGTPAEATSFTKNITVGDMADLKSRGKRFIPSIWTGPARIGGRFWWAQFYETRAIGNNTYFGSMFDEVDESTAIYKVAANKSMLPVEVPAHGPFITLDADGENLPSDFYLRLGGEASRVLRGERALTPDRPITQ